MEDGSCSWVNGCYGWPQANLLHTSSLQGLYAEGKVKTRRTIEVLVQEGKHFHCFQTPVKDWDNVL